MSQTTQEYGVYYNKEGTSPLKPYDNGYGYSMRFPFSPIMDINQSKFIKYSKIFTDKLEKFINGCFLDKRIISQEKLKEITKWQNSVLMFNTAYEFASINKYDPAILILLSILESIFLKNTGNKKILLAESIVKFTNDERSADLIKDIYTIRNKFIHEGIGLDNMFMRSKSLNEYQGFVAGMKPFSHNGVSLNGIYKEKVENLLKLVIEILLK